VELASAAPVGRPAPAPSPASVAQFQIRRELPDEIALLAIMSKLPPFGSLTVMVPAPDSAGLLFHCEVAFSVPAN